jgi:CrcB protein
VKRSDVTVIVAIGVGGALGTLARYGVEFGGDVGRDGFPWPTLLVNVSGAFVLGLVYTLLGERVRPTPYLRAFFAIGFLGAYTTFSTWTAETALFVRDGALWMAATYALATVLAGIVATVGGMAAGRAWPARAGGTQDARRRR